MSQSKSSAISTTPLTACSVLKRGVNTESLNAHYWQIITKSDKPLHFPSILKFQHPALSYKFTHLAFTIK